MRTPQRMLMVIAALGAGACASSDVPESEYDEVARIMGDSMSSELRAVADSALLARDQLPAGFGRDRSGLVQGIRGDIAYRYFVVCTDATGFAIDTCGPTTERALVLASWLGPVRRGGYWTITDPWQPTAMVTGDTWFDYDAGTYHLSDYRDMMLVVQMDYQVVTAGGMTARITLQDGAAPKQAIHGDIELTSKTATIMLDGVHTTTVDVAPVLIR